MATKNKNLSTYKEDSIPSGASYKVAIVTSEWNEDITSSLHKGAKETLLKHGVRAINIKEVYVPGTFELALGAQLIFEKSDIDGVICIGSVIQGETRHFDFVCEAAAHGIKDVGLKFSKAAIFCVLTDNTLQQAKDRSGGKHGNKGIEAAIALLKMIHLQKS